MPKYKFDEIAFNSTEKKKPTEQDKYTYLGLEHLDPGTLSPVLFFFLSITLVTFILCCFSSYYYK